MYKNRDACIKLLFCQFKPIGFLPFLLPSPSLLLKLPNYFDPVTRHKPCSLKKLAFRLLNQLANGYSSLENTYNVR